MATEEKPKVTSFEKKLDRAIAFIAPQTAHKMAVARAQYLEFSYDAANPGNLRVQAGSQARNSSSESPKSRRDRIRLMWEARQGSNDICLIRGLMWKIPTYVVGRLSYKANTGDVELDKIYNDYFREWAKKADVTGRFSLKKLTQVALRSMLIDGDHGALMLQTEEGVKLQMIESDRIGSPLDATVSEFLISGVEIDEQGIPVNYHIYKRNPVTTQYLLDGKYPASQFLHIFDPFRIDQYRGVTHLATAIPHLRDLYELFGYEKVGTKFAAMWAAFVTKKDPFGGAGTGNGSGNPVAGWDQKNAITGQQSWEAQPGRVQVLDPDTAVTMANGSNRPSGAFMNLCMALIREASISLDLPYEFIYDMSMLGGATSRISLQQAQRRFEDWQETLVDKFLEPIKNTVIDYAIATGQLPGTEFSHNGRFTFGAQITADLAYESQTDRENLMFGLDSASNILEKKGRDFDGVTQENIFEINEAQKKAAQNGVPMELMAPQRFTGATELLAAMNTPVEQSSPVPGSLQAVGEKGAKQIFEILTGVTQGTMDRESAKNTLITVYGLMPDQAEDITPPQGKRDKQESGKKEMSASSRLIALESKLDGVLFGKPRSSTTARPIRASYEGRGSKTFARTICQHD
jgi:lambda family phage portal protein